MSWEILTSQMCYNYWSCPWVFSPSEDNGFFFFFFWLLFTWSIKCLSCTSSSLKSLLWRWAFNLVKNSFCLLMSVAKIKEPSCCSISCLHPPEWKRKHTHTQSKSFCGGRSILSSPSGLYAHFCLCYCSIHRVPAPHSTRVVLSPIIASVFGQKICHELCSVIETSGEQSSRSLFIPMLPMGGKTESQLEMYALRRMEKRLSHRCFGCAVTVFKPAETRRFAWGKKRV